MKGNNNEFIVYRVSINLTINFFVIRCNFLYVLYLNQRPTIKPDCPYLFVFMGNNMWDNKELRQKIVTKCDKRLNKLGTLRGPCFQRMCMLTSNISPVLRVQPRQKQGRYSCSLRTTTKMSILQYTLGTRTFAGNVFSVINIMKPNILGRTKDPICTADFRRILLVHNPILGYSLRAW